MSIRRPDLISRAVAAEAVILDSDSGHVHQLNETARSIWDRCDGAHSAEDIAAYLAAIYNAPQERILSDVIATLENFETLGLLTPAVGPIRQNEG